jgi:DNA-binding HxlR family transcriptional regulator
VLADRWSLLIIREALYGVTRFEFFRANLDIAPDVLSGRLAGLIGHGILIRRVYQDAGRRARYEYLLTVRGRQLHLVIGALQQWGDVYRPRPEGPATRRYSRPSGQLVRIAFVTEGGLEVPHDRVDIVPVGPRILHLTWLQWNEFPSG